MSPESLFCNVVIPTLYFCEYFNLKILIWIINLLTIVFVKDKLKRKIKALLFINLNFSAEDFNSWDSLSPGKVLKVH